MRPTPPAKPSTPQQKAAALQDQLDKLTLVCAAMWELLKQKTALTEEELAERIAIIDIRDGVADARSPTPSAPAPSAAAPSPRDTQVPLLRPRTTDDDDL